MPMGLAAPAPLPTWSCSPKPRAAVPGARKVTELSKDPGAGAGGFYHSPWWHISNLTHTRDSTIIFLFLPFSLTVFVCWFYLSKTFCYYYEKTLQLPSQFTNERGYPRLFSELLAQLSLMKIFLASSLWSFEGGRVKIFSWLWERNFKKSVLY